MVSWFISLFLARVFFAVFLTIIVCIILKMNNILNIMLFYGLMVYPPFLGRPKVGLGIYIYSCHAGELFGFVPVARDEQAFSC